MFELDKRLSAVVICSFALVACGKPQAVGQAAPTTVKVATVDRAGSAAATRYSAQIAPATRVDLAFKVGGYIASIAKAAGVDGKPRVLQEGDSVRAGTELASLRVTDYAQKLDEAKAALAQARASAEQAKLDFERTKRLAANGSVAESELDSARIKVDSVTASVDGARVRVDEAQTSLADTSLRSPIDGVVIKRQVEVGALAAPGTVAFTVAEIQSVKAVFGVPDTVLPRVRLGASQAVTTEAYRDVRFEGRITRVAPAADSKSRVFEVEVTIPNADQRLKTGMVAALSLADGASPQATDPEPLVPLSAIVRSASHPGQFAVYVVDENGGKPVARAHDVELGEYLGSVIPVTHGLRGGEQIVVMGAGLLADGEPVQVIP